MRRLVYLGNIHGGGALQVSISFLDFFRVDDTVDIVISPEIKNELVLRSIDASSFEVVKHYGISLATVAFGLRRDYDLVFALFGPIYFKGKKAHKIVGFAVPHIVWGFPRNANPKFPEKIKLWVKRYLFTKYNVLIVESIAVQNALAKQNLYNSITVIPNALNRRFKEEGKGVSFNTLGNRLGYLGSGYPHKNIDFLITNWDLIKSKTTVRELHLSLEGDSFNGLVFHGTISNAYALEYYENFDILVFPTTLECFSITPMEAMSRGKLCLISDYEFNKSVYGNNALYFDAEDINSLIDIINYCFRNMAEIAILKQKAFEFAHRSYSSEERVRDYRKLLGL